MAVFSLGSLCVTACTGPPVAPEVEVREFSLASGMVTGTLTIPVLPAGPKPVVVRPLVDEGRVLERGIGVVSFTVHWEKLAPQAERQAAERERGSASRSDAGVDAPAGPKTVGRWLLAAARPGRVGHGYFQLVGGEARRVLPIVLDHLEAQADVVDPERMAMGGSSTAGFVALEALQQDPRLAVGVVRVACGDYHAFLRDSSLALDGNERWLSGGRVVLDADYEATLSAREPVRFADAFPPRPLLMLNGAVDRAIPVACALETSRAFQQAYEQAGVPDHFRFVLYEDRGHDLGPPAEEEVLAWWRRWLLGD